MNNTNQKRGNFISVLAVYFAANVIFIMSPAMNSIATELYPDIAYGTVLLLSTISSLFMIPGSLAAGAVLGKQVGFKQMAVVSLGGTIIAGVLPYFITNFTTVLILRIIVGFCIGLGFPLQSTLALKLFDDSERPGVLGKATVAMSAGSIIYMLVSGAVCDISASYVWLVHGILIIPLILVLIFLKEPDKSGTEQGIQGSAADSSQNSPGEKLPLMAAFASAMFMIVFFAFYPILLNMSAIVDQDGLGTAAVTGIISSLFTIGNAIAGVIFAGVYKAAGRFTIPVGLVLWAAGTAIFSFGHNLPMIVIGVVVCGIAVQIVWPGTINSFAGYVPPSKQSMASALFVSGMNLGCFLTSFYITGVADLTGNADPRLPCQIGLVIVIIFAVIWSIAELDHNKKTASTKDAR